MSGPARQAEEAWPPLSSPPSGGTPHLVRAWAPHRSPEASPLMKAVSGQLVCSHNCCFPPCGLNLTLTVGTQATMRCPGQTGTSRSPGAPALHTAQPRSSSLQARHHSPCPSFWHPQQPFPQGSALRPASWPRAHSCRAPHRVPPGEWPRGSYLCSPRVRPEDGAEPALARGVPETQLGDATHGRPPA